ncbi:alpha/beta fold hydrolase [Actinomycetospora endophytica]|uniref:Alpha/beta fold hydrolase n=1 Tax=Actinomycetospora endophytica TaxID=2291215 RepID=A0ABS8PIC5_9PSEU|nr:alpha/beta hydrolase [Actinomycetospora endophytica]MCD2198032.1 alpha/beta fold hydrolase [Actinomycetospora endophytica]
MERFVDAGNLSLCTTTTGDPADPAVLLIMGLGLSYDWWRDDFCDALAARGLQVIRFDNRDVGRSTHLWGPGISSWGFLTRQARPAYTLGDMADDAAAVIGALAPAGAHVVGASLGAMVAQEVAIRHPERTLSLTSIMGRPGDRRTGKVSWRRVPDFLRPPAADPVEGMVRAFRRIGSTYRTPEDDDDVRVTMRRAAGREATVPHDGQGSGRQLAACVAERDRTEDLRRLTTPALVVHGDVDAVIQPSGGRATAAAIPGAELLELPGMGHDLARSTWPAVIDGIERTVRVSRTRA